MDLSRMLAALPVGSRTQYGGELVFLNIHAAGSVLGIEVVQHASELQISSLLQHAALGIHDFEAGLCIDKAHDALLLTQWIPQARSWRDVADNLDNLIFQARVWRDICDPAADVKDVSCRMDFDEKQMRKKLMTGHVRPGGDLTRKSV